MRKIQKKLKELGNFTISIKIGEIKEVHSLRDLGETINLMPLFIFNTLGLGKPRPCLVELQVADKTKLVSKGIIEDAVEDAIIKVYKFIIHVDIIVID